MAFIFMARLFFFKKKGGDLYDRCSFFHIFTSIYEIRLFNPENLNHYEKNIVLYGIYFYCGRCFRSRFYR